MVRVFYTRFTKKLSGEKYQQLFAYLTPDMQLQVARFRKWEDAHRSILGKALLLQGLKEYNLPSVTLADLNYTSFQKPYFTNGIHFNTSHSGQYIVCAIGTLDVGIDIEEIKEIPLADFTELFSPEELKVIFEDAGNYVPFYTLWTQKEAFLKAIGLGLNLPLNKVNIQNDTIHYEGNSWFLKELSIQKDYKCYIASPFLDLSVSLKELHF